MGNASITMKLPQGFRDEFGLEAEQKQALSESIVHCLQQRGYTRINTPLVEYEEVFADYEMKNQQSMYRFLNNDNRMLVLRPDLTLPIARFLATNNVSVPQRFYYLGELLASTPEHVGQVNQVTQAGIELVGFASTRAEMECLWLINQFNQKLFNNLLYIELGDATFADVLLQSVVSDANERKAVKAALFAKNIPVYKQRIERYKNSEFYGFLACWPFLFGPAEEIRETLRQVTLPIEAMRIVRDVLQLAKQVSALPGQAVRIDLSSEPPQSYYTGITFRAYVNGVSSYVISGGRYDRLLNNFQSEPEKAVGMGIDIDVLAQIMDYRTPLIPRTLVFYVEEKWPEAAKLLADNPTYSLAIADDIVMARRCAKRQNAKLIVVDEKGVREDA